MKASSAYTSKKAIRNSTQLAETLNVAIIDKLLTEMNRKMSLALVFFNLSKVFDRIYHRIPLHKLAIVGDSPIVCGKSFERYLSARNQVVRIGFPLSSQRPVTRVKCSQVNASQPGK